MPKFIQTTKLKGGGIESAIFNTIVGLILQYVASQLTDDKLIELANKMIVSLTKKVTGLPSVPESLLGALFEIVKPFLTAENFRALKDKISGVLDTVGELQREASAVSPTKRGRGRTWRDKFLAKYDLEDKPYSIKEVAKITKMPVKALQESYNRGIGAWKTNPESVRLQKDFSKNPDMKKHPRSARLTKENWAWARMIAFAMKAPKVFKGADRDIAEKYKLIGGKTLQGGNRFQSPRDFYDYWDRAIEPSSTLEEARVLADRFLREINQTQFEFPDISDVTIDLDELGETGSAREIKKAIQKAIQPLRLGGEIRGGNLGDARRRVLIFATIWDGTLKELEDFSDLEFPDILENPDNDGEPGFFPGMEGLGEQQLRTHPRWRIWVRLTDVMDEIVGIFKSDGDVAATRRRLREFANNELNKSLPSAGAPEGES
jgi:hypothetical protein